MFGLRLEGVERGLEFVGRLPPLLDRFLVYILVVYVVITDAQVALVLPRFLETHSHVIARIERLCPAPFENVIGERVGALGDECSRVTEPLCALCPLTDMFKFGDILMGLESRLVDARGEDRSTWSSESR
ncbi:hypothetical protein [Natrinema gelatinilyticum]|uniref:hypothetical protein n=1 Tax=Natrinema gelatinilyticum TaxID=2961571 RepID=UPI0020C4A155|nr:hypothetical protein [Natrinema gelatinilyticum]